MRKEMERYMVMYGEFIICLIATYGVAKIGIELIKILVTILLGVL